MNFYLEKYGFLPAQIKSTPADDLGLIVVIPCYNETALIDTLTALKNCDETVGSTETIVVVNSSVDASALIQAQNLATFKEAQEWCERNSTKKLRFHVLLQRELPVKHAGVGLARKIGMDEAVARFEKAGNDGIIVCLDADSLCDKNYLTEIENHFVRYPKTPGCSVYFEHPVSGNQFPDSVYHGIIKYELHLRYYRQCLVYCQLPYAFHTVGSSMAVRSSAYQKQGGMNKRKAGEDFYFLHKIIQLGNFSELNSTRVIPSPRISDRVPFGTGKAIGDWVNSRQENFETYNFLSFRLVKEFVELIPELFSESFESFRRKNNQTKKFDILFKFLDAEKFEVVLVEIKKNSTDLTSFINRFYRWLDAFKVLKLVHFLRDNQFPNSNIESESWTLLKEIDAYKTKPSAVELLQLYRALDREK